MSLARTALRLAVIEALNADPTIDAMCIGRIFDSRIGDLAAVEPVPVLTVYTEDDAGSAYSANDGGPPFDETCMLLVEIAMRGTVPKLTPQGQPQPGEFVPAVAESDRQLEALIDLLEQRIIDAVTIADTAQSALVRTVTRRVTDFKSMRFSSDETSVKLALRMLHLTVHLKTYQDDPLSPATGPFAALPEPLRTVAAALPEGSSGLETCMMLVKYAAPSAAPETLTGIDVQIAPRLRVGDLPPEPDVYPAFTITADASAS